MQPLSPHCPPVPNVRLAPKPLDITDDEGFERDTFSADKAATRLGNLVAALQGHSVIVLDGSWGTGKSTFVKQWAGHMRNRGHPVVYFDAFRRDHHTDPLFTMLAALIDLIAPKDHPHPVPERLREQLTTSARGIARIASGIVLDTGARALTGGLVTGDQLEDVLRSASAADDPALDDHHTLFDTKLAQAREEIAAAQDFRDTLATVVTQLTQPDSASPPSSSSLTSWIDANPPSLSMYSNASSTCSLRTTCALCS